MVGIAEPVSGRVAISFLTFLGFGSNAYSSAASEVAFFFDFLFLDAIGREAPYIVSGMSLYLIISPVVFQ